MMKAFPNYGRESLLNGEMRTPLRALISAKRDKGASVISGEEGYLNRVLDLPITLGRSRSTSEIHSELGVTDHD